MRDVAERAGVSQMTVSFVINDTKPVTAQTRDAVRLAIAELGYVPNRAARQLASASELRIGLLHSNVANAFLSSLLVGVLNAASRLDAQVHVEKFDPSRPELLDRTIAHLVSGGVTALLFHSPISEIAAIHDGWRSHGMPAVAIAPGSALAGLPSVGTDEAAAACDMTALLFARGHRRIGFVAGPASHSASAARLAGYRLAHAVRGIAVDEELIPSGDFDFDSGVIAARTLLGLRDRPSAIFASNDAMAAGVVSYALRHGLTLPADLSIAGFDDTPIATQIWPTLTTVRRDVIALAEKGVEMLADMAARRSIKIDDPIRLNPFQIVERHSITTHGDRRATTDR